MHTRTPEEQKISLQRRILLNEKKIAIRKPIVKETSRDKSKKTFRK